MERCEEEQEGVVVSQPHARADHWATGLRIQERI
jgi:hypothetical protein